MNSTVFKAVIFGFCFVASVTAGRAQDPGSEKPTALDPEVSTSDAKPIKPGDHTLNGNEGIWYPYAADSFAVEFPCTNDKLDREHLEGVLVVSGATETSNFAVIVKEFDRAVRPEESEQLLEKGVLAQSSDPKSKIIESTDISHQGVRGKEIILEKSGNTVIGRVFVHRDRLIILSVNQAGNSAISDLKKNSKRFFESFALRG